MNQGGTKRNQTTIRPSGITTDGYFRLKNGTDQDVLLGDGSTTDRLIKDVTAAAIQSEYNFDFITTGNVNNFVTIKAATSTTAGVMTAADKTKLDDVPNIYAESGIIKTFGIATEEATITVKSKSNSVSETFNVAIDAGQYSYIGFNQIRPFDEDDESDSTVGFDRTDDSYEMASQETVQAAGADNVDLSALTKVKDPTVPTLIQIRNLLYMFLNLFYPNLVQM